jgi:hypothetical protein
MNRHRTDAVSLSFGAVFLLVAGWWAIGSRLHIGLPALGWVLAVGLILVGALGLLAALRGGRREPTAGPPEPEPWSPTSLDNE